MSEPIWLRSTVVVADGLATPAVEDAPFTALVI
jgi:hypothetical protein